MKRILGVAADIALSFLIILFVFTLFAPSIFGFTFNTILSGSMEPEIQTGAMIAMKEVPAEKVKVGDIIGFKVEGIDVPVCHRVIEKLDTDGGIRFRTKGDNNEDPDSWVIKPENIRGRVIFDIPYLGCLASFVREPKGFVVAVGIPSAIIIILALKDLFWPKTKREKLKLRKKPNRLPVYLLPLATLGLIAMLGLTMTANTQEKTLGSFAEKSEEAGEFLYVSQRNMQNQGKIPLVICLFSESEKITFSETHFRLPAGGKKEVEIKGNSEDAVIRTACFFPLLPQETLYNLSAWNYRAAPFLAAAVWLVPLGGLLFLLTLYLTSGPTVLEQARLIKKMKKEAYCE